MSMLVALIASILALLSPADTFMVTDEFGGEHVRCSVTSGDPRDASNVSPIVCPDGTTYGGALTMPAVWDMTQ